MLQKKKPDDYVIATGKQYSVKDFVNLVCKKLKIKILWKGKNYNEVGIDGDTKKIIIKCEKKYFRPTEVDSLLGDYKKARNKLKWKPKYNVHDLVDDMINYNLNYDNKKKR
jgi:GDPmannose 4,6-dehydratase